MSTDLVFYQNAFGRFSRLVTTTKIRGSGWAAFEANPAWGAGIYGCDPTRVLSVLARASIRLDSLSVEDARWVREAQRD